VRRVGREAGAGGVEVTGIGMGQVKAEEFYSPFLPGVGVVGGAVPAAGADAAKGVGSGREEAEKGAGGQWRGQ
jgi:hypothetical protein